MVLHLEVKKKQEKLFCSYICAVNTVYEKYDVFWLCIMCFIRKKRSYHPTMVILPWWCIFQGALQSHSIKLSLQRYWNSNYFLIPVSSEPELHTVGTEREFRDHQYFSAVLVQKWSKPNHKKACSWSKWLST